MVKDLRCSAKEFVLHLRARELSHKRMRGRFMMHVCSAQLPLLTTLGKLPVKLQAEEQLLQGLRGPVLLALPAALTPSATLSSPPCSVVTAVSGFLAGWPFSFIYICI